MEEGSRRGIYGERIPLCRGVSSGSCRVVGGERKTEKKEKPEIGESLRVERGEGC